MKVAGHGVVDVRLEPAPTGWKASLDARFESLDAQARHFRSQLGLPADQPIVMTGHQATWWHSGILAKFIAADALATAVGAQTACIVPDQDEQDFATIAFPVREEKGGDADTTSAIAVERVAVAPAVGPGVASASCPAFTPLSMTPASAPATASVSQGLGALRDRLQAHADEASAARQVIGALRDLAAPFASTGQTLFASALCRTDLFQSLVERIISAPEQVAMQYNDAVVRHPEAGLTPMRKRRGAWETPLWRLLPQTPRLRVFSDELPVIDRSELAPRAIFMTGLMRLAACDLFIHGVGGGVYDGASADWFGSWLGEELAPMTVATATLRLPVAQDPEVSAHSVAHAVWLAQAARHNPGLLGAGEEQAKKDKLVAKAHALRHADAAPVFDEMHELLAAYRRAHAQELQELAHRAHEARASLTSRDIALDRTWAFFLHEESALHALRSDIKAMFATARARASARPCSCGS